MPRFTRLALVASLLCVYGPALAVDGVIEISPACVSSGCIPGDAPNFPITISQPGSYRLTGNLTVLADTTAIHILAPNVKLDLGGFEVKGPNTCTGYPPTGCDSAGGAAGIYAPTANEFLVSVRNGTVVGMSGACINLQGNSSSIDEVSAYYCVGSGLEVGAYGRVSRSHASNVRGDGIFFGAGGAAHDNEVRGVSRFGIEGGPNGSITGNRVFATSFVPIYGAATTNGISYASKNVIEGSILAGVISPGDNFCGGNLC